MMQAIPGSEKTWRCGCGAWLDNYSPDWKWNGENYEHAHRTVQWHVTKLEPKPLFALHTPAPVYLHTDAIANSGCQATISRSGP